MDHADPVREEAPVPDTVVRMCTSQMEHRQIELRSQLLEEMLAQQMRKRLCCSFY